MKTTFAPLLAAALAVASLSGCKEYVYEPTKTVELNYPDTRRDSVADNYHGTQVADPYRWLEDDRSAETAEWVKAQNALTGAWLEAIPGRNALRSRLETLMDYPRESAPNKEGDWWYYSRNTGLQNQNVLYRKRNVDDSHDKAEVFLDPNTLSKDGTIALTFMEFSHDARYLAYGVSRAGSDWQEIVIRDMETGKDLPDTLKWAKFSGAAWQGHGFFYSRYDAPKEGTSALSAVNQFHKVCFHEVGRPQSEDQVVYEDKTAPLRYHFAQTTEDQRFLIIMAAEGTEGQALYCRDLTVPNAPLHKVFDGYKHKYGVLDNVNGRLLVRTNMGAPNYRIVSVDPANPSDIKDIVPEAKHLLASAGTAGGQLFVTWLRDASSYLYHYSMDGKELRQIALPDIGTTGGIGGKAADTFGFFVFTSYVYPPTIYRYDFASGKTELYRKSEVKFDPSRYQTVQIFAPSKDGTKIPAFVISKKNLPRDGERQTMLYAYGGFNISMTPAFSTSILPVLEQDGIYVVANLRGGGEYGEDWHRAGMLEKKQNVFDDFIGVAEFLIKEKYSSSKQLAISGGSNGGLLVGACMTQRPDLFAAAFPAVGVLDMLRYHRFTVGWGWVPEYGSADVAAQFPFLYAYSPLHRLKPGTAYPATLITTADHDDRVVPAHSFKFAAALQAAHKGAAPVLIRIETSAGHGAGKPTAKILDEQADKLAFFFQQTGKTYRRQ